MDTDPVAQLLSDPRFKGQPITWGVTSEGYDAIRRAWLTHVHAEEVLFKPFTENEFNTQMKIMLSVFTDDCVMELVPAEERWEGHQQAAEFYRVFLSSLEGMQWVPQALVIGPQGVLDVVNMSGKLVKEFAGLKEVGAQVHLQWVIYFPWVPNAAKFKGEVISRSAHCRMDVLDRENVSFAAVVSDSARLLLGTRRKRRHLRVESESLRTPDICYRANLDLCEWT